MDFNSWNIFWSSAFGLLAVLIIFGNFFTIWVFHRQGSRKRSYFLLISLAVADLMVGLFAIPLFMKNNSTEHSYLWRLVSKSFDVFTGLTSIYTLAVISLERMFAIVCPLRHRTLTSRNYIYAIAIPWMVAAVFVTVLILYSYEIIKHPSYRFLLLLFQTTPLLTMCVAYFSIWIKRKSTMGIQNHRAARESKLANTLFLVTGASLLTWTPFQVFNNLISFDRLRISLTLLYLSRILQFSNSLVNVVIYPLRIPQFKTTFKNIIHYCGAVSQRPTTARSQPAVPLNRITQLRC
ncbi:adenosine receptor A3-like [Pocillopora damicornis]|uniref:adenosine receptor A3-like n=1 Tax=Pocillopora damicornis TaxID=46731 RepID=UPI000F54FCEC|nr:adenosine receptor A3-like [Pocillopora damicornis]